ncbi:MAG: TlpA disulfide reductase family protein [Terracidiphilus sp.]
MHARLLVVPVLYVSLSVSASLSYSQSTLPLPGCEAAPEVRAVVEEKLDWRLLEKMKFSERLAYRRKVLEDLIARSPREFVPVQRYAELMGQYAPEEYAALRARWIQQARDHAGDPLALLVAGSALVGRDTPEAIRLLQAARAAAPHFPLPALWLARVYSTGKRADPEKTRQNIEAYFAACPASTDGYAQWLLNKDQPLQPRVAAALRARLETESDPKRLRDFETLWGLEFRTRPPKDHDVVRAQVALDLKRLEALNPHGDAEWLAFLIAGYKQSGAQKPAITAVEDRLIHDFPHSNQAWYIVRERWDDAHKEPEDQGDAPAWAKHQKEYEEALKGRILDYPDNPYLQREAWFYCIENDDDVTERDALLAMDSFLRSVRDFEDPLDAGDYFPDAAGFLVRKRWQPERALSLLEEAKAAIGKSRALDDARDNLGDEDLKDRKEWQTRQDQNVDGLILKAAIEAGRPEPALALAARVEAAPPEEKKLQSAYWLNRARLAVVQKHRQDAMAYYQVAILTRTEAPKPWHGKLRDDLGDEARALWKELGGTEAAWAALRKPAGGAPEAAEGRWEKPSKHIPDFELSDLSGKTWKLKELGGKTLLINLWATWCGPCKLELPHLEKLYEKTRDRTDIQILTFDLDEDLGVVAPFLKEKGYTFPVLPAYSTVVSLLDGFAIPQTWLVDSHGVWQWKQIGYNGAADADFEKEMLDRLKSTQSNP